MKTKEQVKKYNKEYFARPEVIARAKIRNAQRREKRRLYKKTKRGKEADKRSRKNNWDKNAPLREKKLLWLYGLTPQDFQEMMTKQNGRCAICDRTSDRRLHVDHDHLTGKVRGLLCGSCNRGLGMFGDNMKMLDKASVYLKCNS